MFIGTLPPVSNRATWQESIEFIDDETNELVDLSNADQITVQIREQKCYAPLLSAFLSDGSVVVTGLGVATFTFSVDQMRTLCARTYDIGITIQVDDEVGQEIIGKLPVLDGVVT